MQIPLFVRGKGLIGALISGLLSTAMALPANNSTGGGQGGDISPPKPPLKRTTPLPPPPAPNPAPVASPNALPPGTYTLLVRVQSRVFEAPMLLVRNGNAVVLHPEGGRDELHGDINARNDLSLEFVEATGNRLTLYGPATAGVVSGRVSFTNGVSTASGSFELTADTPSAARKARQGCDANCQAMVRAITAEFNRILKGVKLH